MKSTKIKPTSYFTGGLGFYYINHSHALFISVCICLVGKLVATGTEHRLDTSLPFILVSSSMTLQGNVMYPMCSRQVGDLCHRESYIMNLHVAQAVYHGSSALQETELFFLIQRVLVCYLFVFVL